MQEAYDEYHPRYYLIKYKVTTTPEPCRICGRTAYFNHPDLSDLCYSHFLDLLNVGELKWNWSDHEDIWQITERLLSKTSGFANNTAARSKGYVNVEPLLDGYKTCIKCKIEKHVLEFSVDRSRADGRNNECRECNSIRRRKYYKDNGR